jgi:hypothetical protein
MQKKVASLLEFDIINQMGQERFKTVIYPGLHKGSLIIRTEGGEEREIGNSTKEKYVSPELLGNLRSLAIASAVGEADDSAGQEYLNRELNTLKKKYPSEQPQEFGEERLRP